MEDQSLMTGNGDHGEIGTFANGECSYDDEDEDLINVLEELEINDINSKSFRGLDAVRFDDDDDEEEDLLELYGSSNDGTSQALVPLGKVNKFFKKIVFINTISRKYLVCIFIKRTK